MKGIIVAAGYGTRFLPATKTVPKEMFPLIDKPALDFIIDEFIESGIKDILIITSRRKKIMEDYFDREVELETVFKNENNQTKLDMIKPKDVNIYFTRQREMKGTGHALMLAKSFIGSDPFVVAYPDDLVFSDIPLTKQLIDVYNATGESVLALQEVTGDVSRYGVADIDMNVSVNGVSNCKVNALVEKPAKGTEPSNCISVGRYLFHPDLINYLIEFYKLHTEGEFYHIDAINKLAKEDRLSGCLYSGSRIDVGDKLGYLDGIITYALSRDDLKDGLVELINKKFKNN